MSEDGFSDCFDEPHMEIQIETLMGTTFDIKVSCNDTVGDIKKKIYRVEGIPIYQQNLIYKSEELKDSLRLCDTGIQNGSKLTLVPAMRGGPISTRRLSIAYDHRLLKELKDLLDNTRDEISPGSKVSVLVFKEGDIVNLLRVIENEDGSYSPYNESPISPPSKSKKDNVEAFERLVEDTEMCSKIATLRKKMDELMLKRQIRSKGNGKTGESLKELEEEKDSSTESVEENNENVEFSYKFLEECATELLDNVDLTIFEKNIDDGNQSESEEIALKDKHRTKPKVIQNFPPSKPTTKSLYSERKGAYSHTRQNYARISKRRDARLSGKVEKNSAGYLTYSREKNQLNPEWDQSNLLDSLSDGCDGSYFTTLPTNLPSENIMDALASRLGHSCILQSSNNLNDSELPKDNEKDYLLGGLNSNRLPDLNIMEKDDLLTPENVASAEDKLEKPSRGNVEGNPETIPYIGLPILKKSDKSSDVQPHPRFLPDITSNRTFGPLIPNITTNSLTSASASETRLSNSASLMGGFALSSTSMIPNANKLFSSHSFESGLFPNLRVSSLGGKLGQSTCSRAGTNKLTNSSNTVETSLPSLTRLETFPKLSSSRGESPVLGAQGSAAALGGTSVEEMGAKLAEQLHLLDEEPERDVYGEGMSVSTRNRVHLTRLVLSTEGTERPKSSPNSIELEERTQDLWEIHEPASERLKHSATCKVGLVKRRQGLEYNYDSVDNPQPNLNPELGNIATYPKSSGEFGVYSGTNFYMPQYLSAPSAIPPQYAPKQHQNSFCDLYLRSSERRRAPLYNRRIRKENVDSKVEKCNSTSPNLLGDCSSIQRLKNDDSLFGPKEDTEDFYGYYNLGCVPDLIEKEEDRKEEVKLPPVIKKKLRCNECNKKLNITNIYNCRCGRIFCSQHRYSEVHRCTYDYKLEGRKILERQNPLVVAEKVKRI